MGPAATVGSPVSSCNCNFVCTKYRMGIGKLLWYAMLDVVWHCSFQVLDFALERLMMPCTSQKAA